MKIYVYMSFLVGAGVVWTQTRSQSFIGSKFQRIAFRTAGTVGNWSARNEVGIYGKFLQF